MTTPEEAAAVTPETGHIMHRLEDVADYLTRNGVPHLAERVHAAIDRLIVLDTGRQPTPVVKQPLTRHPREIALQQDSKRGNFRKPLNNDRDFDGA